MNIISFDMSVCVVVKLIVIVVGVNNVFESKDTVPLANESHNRNNHPKQMRRMHIQGPHDRDNAAPTSSITDLYGRVFGSFPKPQASLKSRFYEHRLELDH